MTHTPTITGTGSYGSSATCSCGWQSGQLYRDATRARLLYSEHLTSSKKAP